MAEFEHIMYGVMFRQSLRWVTRKSGPGGLEGGESGSLDLVFEAVRRVMGPSRSSHTSSDHAGMHKPR